MAIDISPEKDGGVLKEILKEGEGDEVPSSGSKVSVHYTGTLLNGTKFDSSKDRKEPFEFSLGQGQVIKAWDIGVATMKRGEVAMLTCDAKYAYGNKGSPPKIPGNATLKFEVEVLGWTGDDLSPDHDGGIERYQITAGKQGDSPNDGSLVDIHLVGKYNGKIFEERDVQFTLGEGEAVNVIRGVEESLLRFKLGEKSRLKIKSKYAFKAVGNTEFNIPPSVDVEYIVELKNFEKTTAIWAMADSEKIQQAKLYKDKGTNYFKAGKYTLAIKMCKKIIEYIDASVFDNDLKAERDQLLLSGYLNLALFHLKVNENFEAKEVCDKALKLDPKNEKALFRRGLALEALSSPEVAIKDFQAVLNVEPKNVAAVKQIAICNNMIKENVAKEKKLYANMFEKFAQADKQ